MQTYNLTCEYLYLCHFTLQKTARQALTTGLYPQVSTLILYSKYGHFDFTHGREGVFFPLQIKPRATRRLSKCCVTELHHEPNNICNLNPKLKKKKALILNLTKLCTHCLEWRHLKHRSLCWQWLCDYTTDPRKPRNLTVHNLTGPSS